jgi:chaperonin GroES
MLVVLLTTMMTIECNGYSVVPQQQRHVRSQQQNQQQWRDHRRDKYRSTIIAKGSDSDNDIATSALRANSIITLDGQEIRQEITAMNNIIFVKVKEALSTTLGGIVIPDQSKQRPTEGTVVACGPGKIHPHSGKRISNPISVGMNVV